MRLIDNFNILGGLFRGSKDQYTQTRNFHTTHTDLNKQEQWVDMSDLFNLYDTTPQLKAVIDRRAAMFANGRFIHKRMLKDGSSEAIENSSVVSLLQNPNFMQSGGEFMEQLSMAFCIYGNQFTYMNRGFSTAIPSFLWSLPSDKMLLVRTGKIWKQTRIEDVVSMYKMQNDDGGGRYEEFEPSEIIQLNKANPSDPVLGISPITSLMMPLSNIRASYGSGNRILTVDGAIGILSSTIKEGAGVPLTTKEQNRLNAGHSAKYGMQDGKNDILMTNATVNWTPMSYPTKDLMLFEHIDSNFKIIIDAFGLNENIFSRKDSSKFSNLQEGLKLAYQDCIIPFAENVAKAFTKSFNLPDGEYLEIDYSHLSILKEDETVKSEVQKRKAETIKILNETGRPDLADLIEL